MAIRDKLAYDNSTLCHICNEEIDEDRVHDHCHLSGKFGGAAHKFCNLIYKVFKFFQLYFTICLAMIVISLLKHRKVANEIDLVYQIINKTTFFHDSGHR